MKNLIKFLVVFVLFSGFFIIMGCTKTVENMDLEEISMGTIYIESQESWITQDFDIEGYERSVRENPQRDSVVDLFGEEIYFGAINSPEEAVKYAERVWIQIYGKKQILEQRPYIVFHEPYNNVWLVAGNNEYLNGGPGGVANIIISGTNGKIVGIWHDE